jgi:hypothetical protein
MVEEQGANTSKKAPELQSVRAALGPTWNFSCDLRVIWMPGGRVLKRGRLVHLAGKFRAARHPPANSVPSKASVMARGAFQLSKKLVHSSNIRHLRR